MKVLLVFLALVAICGARPYHLNVEIPTDSSFVEFMKGFLEGINETGDINKLLECIHSGEEIINKIKAALELIAKKDIGSIFAGITMLVDAVKTLMSAMQPCMEGFDQLKRLMNAITHIDIMKIVMKVLTHLSEFIGDVVNAIGCFKSGDMHCAGKNVGSLLNKLFLNRMFEDENPAIEFIKGFLVGIHEPKSVDDLMKCIKNMDSIFTMIREALGHIMKLSFEEVVTGLKILMEAMKQFHEMLAPCLDGFQQLKKLMEAMKNWDLVKIAWKIISQAVAFIHDIKECIESLQTQKFNQAGKDMGDILYRLFLSRVEPKDNKIVDFLAGFLEGLNEKGDINELMKCVKNLEQVIDKIMQALEFIKLKDPANIIKGLTLLLQAVTELLNILKPCSDGFEQIKKLLAAFSHIDIIKLAFKILANPGPFIQDVMNCIEFFKSGNLHGAGKNLGDFLYRLFLSGMIDELQINFDDIIKFVEGFLEGINEGHNFDNIEQCLKDLPNVLTDVKKAIEEIKNIDWKNMDKLVEALMAIFDAFQKVLAAIKPCSKVPGDVDKIIEKLMNIDVNKLLSKIMANIMQLIHDITEGLEKLSKHDYKGFGQDIGDILFKLVLQD
jgi:molecular chaperone GrpE (heat shock protein)